MRSPRGRRNTIRNHNHVYSRLYKKSTEGSKTNFESPLHEAFKKGNNLDRYNQFRIPPITPIGKYQHKVILSSLENTSDNYSEKVLLYMFSGCLVVHSRSVNHFDINGQNDTPHQTLADLTTSFFGNYFFLFFGTCGHRYARHKYGLEVWPLTDWQSST